MNLVSIDKLENGVHLDAWSASSPTFGENDQLTVLGWTYIRPGVRQYIVKCRVCEKDPEMFGDGYFKTVKGSLVRGVVPCGCSNIPMWSQDQWLLRLKRKIQELGMEFISVGQTKISAASPVSIKCPHHGLWETRVTNLLHMGTSCEKCSRELSSVAQIKPDDVMISSFFASGIFHPDTKFWRSDKKTSQGGKSYWFSLCPVCDTQSESRCTSLQYGHCPCECGRKRQRECYVNLIENKGGVTAVKFGIACNSERRLRQQDNKAIGVRIVNFAVYKFPDYNTCKLAERLCKQELECAYVSKDVLPDGYTETTSVLNLNRILEIYESCGGVLTL